MSSEARDALKMMAALLASVVCINTDSKAVKAATMVILSGVIIETSYEAYKDSQHH